MPASLVRRYDEPVEVERLDDRPAAFTRQGRRYAVRAVLARWWETDAWWLGDEPGAGPTDHEREMWRVEAAAPGRAAVTVDLCWSWTTGRWTLVAVQD